MIQRTIEKSHEEYSLLLREIKEQIQQSQVKASFAVNQELIALYWRIGSGIDKRQQQEGWGAKTIEKLAKDLQNAFPSMKGFSHRNLKYMVHFAREYPNFPIRQQAVAQIPCDNLLCQTGDHPSMGLLLCKTKEKVIAEYALQDINKPIGVSQYETALIESLPDNLKGSLPTIEEIEQEFF